MTNESTRLYVGCISGTSVDGLDIALIAIGPDDRIHLVQADTVALPVTLREQLLMLGRPGEDDLDQLGYCDSELGAFIGEALLTFLRTHDVQAHQVHAIGSHGQTVRHRPPDAVHPLGFTTQIGDPNRIAEITGITTVADFRRRDMAAGGQGAPLVPPFHQALFGHLHGSVVVLNIGGISNISILAGATGNQVSGFDTGPGNALMDSWCAQHLQQPYDAQGAWAASGKVVPQLLRQCLADPYFKLPPPKSTGREYFNLAWLEQHENFTHSQAADVQATLCELTVRCTADALAQWAPDTTHLIVCGGGRLNTQLMQSLAQHVDADVTASEDWQIDGDSIEAALFGWLAARTLNGQPGNEPAVTGARDYRVLGAVYQG